MNRAPYKEYTPKAPQKPQETPEKGKLMQGRIKFLEASKGYGFVTQDGQDTFFHASKIADLSLFEQLERGDTVSYEITEGRRGPEAVIIDLISAF